MRDEGTTPVDVLMGRKRHDRRLVINVGGTRHETYASTLANIPETRLALLAHLLEADESYDPVNKEYFFDRNPNAFQSILHFYRSDEFHVDQNLCGNILQGELEYWDLNESDIEPCCWGMYSKFKDHKDTLTALDDNFVAPIEEEWIHEKSKLAHWKKRIWHFLEDPTSSRAAKAFAVISMSFVIVSIFTFVLETHPMFRVSTGRNVTIDTPEDNNCCCGKKKIEYPLFYILEDGMKPHPAMEIIDYICISFFTFEFVIRFIFSPEKIPFLKGPLNIIDMLCLVPLYISVILKILDPTSSTGSLFKIILILRVIRVLRIFKLMKHYTAFKILVYTIKVSTKELLLMVIFLFTGVLIFACLIYYCENANFSSIPIGFWWALVTMTTVGYGDKYPKQEIGYLLGSCCVICGVLTIAFTVPIVVNNFTLYYGHAQSRQKLEPSKRRSKKTFSDKFPTVSVIPNLSEGLAVSKTFNHKADACNNLNIHPIKRTPRDKKIHNAKTDSKQSIMTSSDAIVEDLEPAARSPSLNETVFDDVGEEHRNQTSQMLSNLEGVTQKLLRERQRQVWLIHQRRKVKQQQRDAGSKVTPDEKY